MKESGCFSWTKPCDSLASGCLISGLALDNPVHTYKNSKISKVQYVFNQEEAIFTEIQNVILKLNWEKFLVIKELHNVTQVWKSEQYKVASTRNFTGNINMATCIYFKIQGRGKPVSKTLFLKIFFCIQLSWRILKIAIERMILI